MQAEVKKVKFNTGFHLVVLICGLFLMACIPDAGTAQTASVQGIVTEEFSGQPLVSATIILQDLAGEQVAGRPSDRNGFYQIRGIEPGRYLFRISYIGFESYMDTLSLMEGELRTVSVALNPDEQELDEVVVSLPGGAARVEAGRQRVTPADMSRVPTPSGSGDMANYLQTLPGVVTAGDRGGQLYIRGGLPSENMTLIDGATIFQPFHIVGFFSALPEDLVSSADFYAGGFGPRYTGRLSAVLDVQMRDGNRYETHGFASASPFVGELLMEGPITPGKTSWIASARRSMIEQTSPLILGEEQPFRFESQYLKLTHFSETDTRCSILGMRTYDRGQVDIDLDEIVQWKNVVVGTRCVTLPEGSSILFDINGGLSYVSNSIGSREDPEFFSNVIRINLDVHLTQYVGAAEFNYGLLIHINNLDFQLREEFGGPQSGNDHLFNIGGYLETAIPLGDRLEIRPGGALTFHRYSYSTSLEPRIRVSWQPFGRDTEELNAAFGVYHQSMVGISDKQDAGSVFTAWMPSPLGGPQQEALHFLLSWRQEIGGGFNWSLEGYHKQLDNLSVPAWNPTTRYTTDLSRARGEVYGGDIRLEYRDRTIYGFIGYGYGWSEYTTPEGQFSDWAGDPDQSFHPPHDRRHQVSALMSIDIGPYTAGLRWQYGTGFPYVNQLGFFEALPFSEQLPVVREPIPVEMRLITTDGRLPVTHRLDLSLERSFELETGNLNFQAGAINLYGQDNLFYYDIYTRKRVNQLPFAPYISLKWESR